MDDARTRKMTHRKAMHTFPRPLLATTVTTTPKCSKPEPSCLADETVDAVDVARDSVIIHPALHNAPQPTARFAHRPVHSLSQISLDLL